MPVRTIQTLFSEARTLLQDTSSLPAYRYADSDLMESFNAAMIEVRVKRPDLFLDIGLNNPIPLWDASVDLAQAFPVDISVYNAVLYYVAGRSELREDIFADNSRSTVLMNKFTSQLLTVVS